MGNPKGRRPDPDDVDPKPGDQTPPGDGDSVSPSAELSDAQIKALLENPAFASEVDRRAQSKAEQIVAPVRSKARTTDEELKRVAELVAGGKSQEEAIKDVKIERLLSEDEPTEPGPTQAAPISDGKLIGDAARTAASQFFSPDVPQDVKNRILDEVGKASEFLSEAELIRFVTSKATAKTPVPDIASTPQGKGPAEIEADKTEQEKLRAEFLAGVKGKSGDAYLTHKETFAQRGLENTNLD